MHTAKAKFIADYINETKTKEVTPELLIEALKDYEHWAAMVNRQIPTLTETA